MLSKAKRDAANVASARPSTSGSARGVKTAGGTESKWCSNMASEDKRDVADGATPSTSGSAISFRKTPEEIKLDLKDTWTTRILVSTGPVAGIASGMFLGRLFRRNPKLVLDVFQWGFKKYGDIKNLWRGSIIIELDCGSQEKYLKFQEDFKDGKVKDALEEELRKIGCHVELKLTLTDRTSTVAAIETSEGTVDQESGETSFDELVKKAEQMWHQRAGHHLTSCATEVKQEWREEPHNVERECKGSGDQMAGKAEEMWHHRSRAASGSTEVKQEKKSGSAAKKPKLDPIGEPGTSEVSNTSETGKFKVQYKVGVPGDRELLDLSIAIASKWESVGILLGLSGHEIDVIKFNESDKAFRMLLDWKNNTTSLSLYQDLYRALCDDKVQLNSIAQTFCLE